MADKKNVSFLSPQQHRTFIVYTIISNYNLYESQVSKPSLSSNTLMFRLPPKSYSYE